MKQVFCAAAIMAAEQPQSPTIKFNKCFLKNTVRGLTPIPRIAGIKQLDRIYKMNKITQSKRAVLPVDPKDWVTRATDRIYETSR
jgi:hypothetical protein